MFEEHWASTALPVRRQLAGFQDVFDRTHSHWTLKSAEASGYHAEVQRRQIGRFALTNIVCDPVLGVRDDQDAKAEKNDYFCLLFFEAGDCLLEQGRHETVVRRNSIALWDSTRPARFHARSRLAQHSILVPHGLAKSINPRIEDLCGTSIDGQHGMGAILLSHLRRLHRHIGELPAEQGEAALSSAIDLLALMYKPRQDLASSSSYRQALIDRVQDFVIANLNRPDLSPSMIAREFRFSPRYLHRLFAGTGLTIGEWIRKRRLMAARNDLACLRSKGEASITEVALRRGFSSSSHFSRTFKEEFGLSPRDYRQSVSAG